MAMVLTDDENYKNIADTIREIGDFINGETYKPEEMPQGIVDAAKKTKQDGYELGTSEGFGQGREIGFAEGIEQGKQAEREEFWNDSFDKDSPNGFFPYFFAGMTADNFEKFIYPNDKIKPSGTTGAEGMFAFFNRNARVTSNPAQPIDMTEFCSHADFSTCINTTNTFANARVKNLILDLSSCESLNYTFSGTNGGYIDNITLKVTSKAKSYTNTFYYASFLTQITFTEDSEIAASINFAQSQLNKASFESVVAALSPTVTGKTVIFNKSAKEAAFTADEWAALIATKSNWTFSLV